MKIKIFRPSEMCLQPSKEGFHWYHSIKNLEMNDIIMQLLKVLCAFLFHIKMKPFEAHKQPNARIDNGGTKKIW